MGSSRKTTPFTQIYAKTLLQIELILKKGLY